MLQKIIEEIFEKILEINKKGDTESIPHSDVFSKDIISTMGLTKAVYKQAISILIDSHRLLYFGIAKEDERNSVEKIIGYIEADVYTVKKLKNIFQKALTDKYEEDYSKRLGAHQVIREIFPQMHILNNTPIGYIANKAIMLEELENLMEKLFREYTDEWKETKYKELLRENEAAYIEETEGLEKEKSKDGSDSDSEKDKVKKNEQRAVDQGGATEVTSVKTKESLEKVLKIYGVRFFFRVNLRKYNFEFIKDIINRREIERKSDLQILKDMILKIKQNLDRDPDIKEHIDELYKLERAVVRNMRTSRM